MKLAHSKKDHFSPQYWEGTHFTMWPARKAILYTVCVTY